MSKLTKADDIVQELVKTIKESNHHPRLEEAQVVVCFEDVKPFKKDRFHWGKVTKFPSAAKAFNGEHYDFIIVLPYAGYEMLSFEQRKAWLDLHLETCQVEYIPEVVVENKKKKIVTDEFGRKVYTTEIKRNQDGTPKWKKVPMDLPSFTKNVKRFGPWIEEINEFKLEVEKK